jgi:hypothetical protein
MELIVSYALIVTELVCGGSLFLFCANQRRFPAIQAKSIVGQFLVAVQVIYINGQY